MKKWLVLLGICRCISASYWTEWEENANNPVFDPSDPAYRAYYPSVIYDANQFDNHGDAAYYKMWFGTHVGISYTFSNDGINWAEFNNSAPLVGLLLGGNHPFVVYDENGFGGGSYYYKIWYWNSSAPLTSPDAICYAESVDGVVWENNQAITQDATQYIVGGSGYFFHLYGPGSVIYNPNATNTLGQPFSYAYVMFYDLGDGTTPNGDSERTGLAYSTDGKHWYRFGPIPVLIPSGNASDWDGKYRFRASVFKIGDTYHMYYSGANGQSPPGVAYAQGIGHAYSSDGINWTVDPDNPVFRVTDGVAWRDDRTYTPCLWYDAQSFSTHGEVNPLKMWFSGSDGSNIAIGYASNSSLSMSHDSYAQIDRMWLKEELVITWQFIGSPPPGTLLTQFQIYRQDPGGENRLVAQVAADTHYYVDINAQARSVYTIVPVFSNP